MRHFFAATIVSGSQARTTTKWNAERKELFYLLGATVLWYLPDFIGLVEVKFESCASFGGWPSHPFLQEIWVAAVGCGIRQENVTSTLYAWSEKICEDFAEQNFAFASMRDVARLEASSAFQVDTRSFLSTIRELQGVTQSLICEVHDVKLVQRSLVSEIRDLRQELAANIFGRRNENLLVADIPEDAEANKDTGNSVTADASTERRADVVRFPASQSGLKMPQTMIDFYLKGWFEVYNDSWRASGSQTVVDKHVKKLIRACVDLGSLFLTAHISELPGSAHNTASPEAPVWRADVTKKCNEAWKRALVFMSEQGMSKSDACSTFEKNMKQVDPAAWPEGPSEDEDKFGVLRTKAQLQHDLLKNRAKKRARVEVPV